MDPDDKGREIVLTLDQVQELLAGYSQSWMGVWLSKVFLRAHWGQEECACWAELLSYLEKVDTSGAETLSTEIQKAVSGSEHVH